MRNLPSNLSLTAAVTTLGCLALLLVVPQAQAQQTDAIEAELRQQMQAELRQRLESEQHMQAELRQQMEAEQQVQAELRRQLEAELRQRMQAEQQMQAELRHQMEAAQRQEHAVAQAAEELRQQRHRVRALRFPRGCDAFGDTVLDFAEELELSEEQAEQIRDAQRAARRAAIERNADIEVGELDLEALYEDDTPDLTAIRAQLEELAMLNVDQQMAGFSLRAQVREVLSEAQREQLQDIGMSEGMRIVISGAGSSLRVGNFGC